ncbi:hypothetical protein BURPS1710A_1202 [Burkholderia pseudomallei 1710a]|uniref:Uncharacterized protein n=1 Tax=Burkholderia pseudomallei 1710a TaxID=320371 RepID=A0A0E1W1D7_BURPE|nr:hypothetical protein BURPS1710A_1202 [Burkholderia pseudomallei 1710a]
MGAEATSRSDALRARGPAAATDARGGAACGRSAPRPANGAAMTQKPRGASCPPSAPSAPRLREHGTRSRRGARYVIRLFASGGFAEK